MTNEIKSLPPVAPAPVVNNDANEFQTKKEIAARLKVTTRTVENWMRRGVLPFIAVKKVRMFYWPDVLQHLKANHQVCRRSARR